MHFDESSGFILQIPFRLHDFSQKESQPPSGKTGMLTKSGRMWFRALWRLEVNYENEKKITKTAVFPRNGHSWLRQIRYSVIPSWLSISCLKK